MTKFVLENQKFTIFWLLNMSGRDESGRDKIGQNRRSRRFKKKKKKNYFCQQ